MEGSHLIQKAKEFGQLDRECIELYHERVKPASSEELTEYLSELMALCDQGFSLWNDIKIGLGEVANVRALIPKRDKFCDEFEMTTTFS